MKIDKCLFQNLLVDVKEYFLEEFDEYVTTKKLMQMVNTQYLELAHSNNLISEKLINYQVYLHVKSLKNYYDLEVINEVTFDNEIEIFKFPLENEKDLKYFFSELDFEELVFYFDEEIEKMLENKISA